MARLRGRAPRSERLRAGLPHGHWRTTTFVAGLRLGGIDAPMVIDGPINGEVFLAYVERVLVPTLRYGDVVVVVEAAGAELRFLVAPYTGLRWRRLAWGIERNRCAVGALRGRRS
jgi:hypothetical protein